MTGRIVLNRLTERTRVRSAGCRARRNRVP